MRQPLARAITLLLMMAALGGCSALAALDRAAAPQDVHELRAPSDVPVARRASRVELSVEPPATGGAINTDRILVRSGPTQVAYLPEARWSASAPEMLQAAMVEMLLRSNAFAFVGRRPLGVSGDLVLVTTLLDFEAVVASDGEAASVEMTLVARLVREQDAAIRASRTFDRSVAIPDTSTDAILAGYQAVSDAVLAELGQWVIASAR